MFALCPLVVFAQLDALAKDAGLLYFGTAVSPSDGSDSAYYKLENDIRNFGQYNAKKQVQSLARLKGNPAKGG
ncbi:hypothetical protein B0T26DRAFT_749420 [Lasiosphaeria miniovina]|uniref:Uncharacterized protein n=1 Tax=Lasiosphaeria miniovina TaxID=1954250 RepID=A0AA40E476_9PEZI|nr:uncharacterized protein B0T26DRAFT_749420 [Lasiosphaeria miniovina]KAK0721953.1 hypothetical protein B0T26DRAFT_749420 [Lasiosphaeria miniovina]